jgi:uncharacterized protein (UPF0333 family)
MKFNLKKAQGALEYLLIVGAALLIAVIVMSLMSGISSSNKDNVQDSDESFQRLIDQTIIPPIISNVNCGDGSTVVYTVNESPTTGVVSYCVVVDDETIYDNCSVISNALISFDFNQVLEAGDHTFSLVAIKNQAYSRPSSPAFNCKVQ